MHPQTGVLSHISCSFLNPYFGFWQRDRERVWRAAFPRLCSLAPENHFFGVPNLSGCSLETAPHFRHVTLKCHFWSPNRSAFSFLIGRKLTDKLQGISPTAVNSQKYFTAAKTIECGLNEQYALFIPQQHQEHAFHFSVNNPGVDFWIFFTHTEQVKKFLACFYLSHKTDEIPDISKRRKRWYRWLCRCLDPVLLML